MAKIGLVLMSLGIRHRSVSCIQIKVFNTLINSASENLINTGLPYLILAKEIVLGKILTFCLFLKS